jgi:hypothetical protein
MKQFIRILVVLLSLTQSTAWTIFTAQVWKFGNSFKGVGDGAGTGDGGSALLSVLLIGAVWLFPVSPYLCIIAGSLNLIEGKPLRVAYVYSLVALSIMTLIMLLSFQRRLELMALGNILVAGLWACAFSTVEPKAVKRSND